MSLLDNKLFGPKVRSTSTALAAIKYILKQMESEGFHIKIDSKMSLNAAIVRTQFCSDCKSLNCLRSYILAQLIFVQTQRQSNYA